MRTIIAGSRGNYHLTRLIDEAVKAAGWMPTVVLSGCAYGIDQLGEDWAAEQGIAIERYSAEWDYYGRSAGYRRNVEMAKQADAAIVLWDGQSKGSRHMIDIALARKLRLSIYLLNQFNRAATPNTTHP